MIYMENLGYYNGKFGPLDELTVPFNDRVHFFGDGVYEATPARNHKIYALDEHIDRFYRSASMLDIKIPYTKAELAEILCDLVKKVDSPDQFVYWQATRGTAIRNHVYDEDMKANLWVSLKAQKIKDIYTPISAITAPDTRFYHCNIKTLNLLPSVMYAQQAQKAGVYETILYRSPERVTECSHSNVHIINQKGVLQTAPLDNLILPGIARRHLLDAALALGYEVDETPFSLEELMGAREVIITSSSAFCMICNNIDGKPVGGKEPEMIAKLQKAVMDDFIAKTN